LIEGDAKSGDKLERQLVPESSAYFNIRFTKELVLANKVMVAHSNVQDFGLGGCMEREAFVPVHAASVIYA
jgi:hypothetical protein